jgi:cobalt-zinc-cadmium efflux system outer membrane protein
MKKTLLVFSALMVWGSFAAVAADQAQSAAKTVEKLTLDQAIEMAEELQPQLAEARAAVAAAEGRSRQAGAFPNPEAILGAQQIPLRNSAPNEREYVAGVGQTIPLSSRLSKAREAELLDREVRARGLEAKQREVRRQVHAAFATALFQDRAFQTQSTVLQNAEKLVSATKARLEAGDATREDLARSEMETARVRVEVLRVEALHKQAVRELAVSIGDADLDVKSLEGTLDVTFEIPTLEVLDTNLASQPEILQANADIQAQQARLELAEIERIPDVKVELLYHRLEATQSDTLDIGLSIPLPLFSRNQGRIREARAEMAAAEARARNTQNEVRTRTKTAHQTLTLALANRRTFQAEILPRADIVLNSAVARYEAGDISLSELLPVRRDWASAQLSYLESLRDVMHAWADLSAYVHRPAGLKR